LASPAKARKIAESTRFVGLAGTLLLLLECKQARFKERAMAAAATVMADQTLDSRVARLESDVAHIRADVAEMKLDIRDLRKGVGEIDKSLRVEVGGLREQMQKLEGSTALKLAGLDHKLTRVAAETRIWMLLQVGALLCVISRALRWI